MTGSKEIIKSGDCYYLDGVMFSTLSEVSSYLFIGKGKSLQGLNNVIDEGIKRRNFISKVNKRLNCNIESEISRSLLFRWFEVIYHFEDFEYLCSNYSKVLENHCVFWFYGSCFDSWEKVLDSINMKRADVRKLLKIKPFVQIIQEVGYRKGNLPKIVCSDGSFNSVKEFVDYLGISYCTYKSYQKRFRSGEKDFYEGILLASKLRKEFSLKYLPKIENIVCYNGKYYPGANFLLKDKDNCSVISNNRKANLYKVLKKGEDDYSKVCLEDNNLVLLVNGVNYGTVEELVSDYGLNRSTFMTRLKAGLSIYESLTIEKNAIIGNGSIHFLGKDFRTVVDLCDHYKIDYQTWYYMTKSNGKEKVERLFSQLFDLIKESNVNCYDRLEFIIQIAKALGWNKTDIVYQLRNMDKIQDGCVCYLGGKSYKSVVEFYKDYNLNPYKGVFADFLHGGNYPVCVIADILSGSSHYNFTEDSPSIYLYLYFKEYMSKKTVSVKSLLKEIRGKIKDGYSVGKIKNRLSTIKHFQMLYNTVYNNVLSEEVMINAFNVGSVSLLNSFLSHSNTTILKRSYTVGCVSYYLCVVGNSIEYISGNELLEIALESVKDIKVEN